LLTVESEQQCRRADHGLAADYTQLDVVAIQLVDDPSSVTGARRRQHPRPSGVIIAIIS